MFLAAVWLGLASNAIAETFIVDNFEDAVDMDPGNRSCAADVLSPTACTLRAAVMEANENGNPDEADTIVIPEAANISLTLLTVPESPGAYEGDLNITEDLEILGGNLEQPSATPDIKNRLSVVDAILLSNRIFRIENSANVLLRGLALQACDSPANGGGGAIQVLSGTLTVEQSWFALNQAIDTRNGGAIEVNSGARLVLDNTDFHWVIAL